MLQARPANKPVNPIQYPVLRRSKRTGTVVLFTTRFRGMPVIAQNQAHSQDVGKTHSWTEPCDNEAAWVFVHLYVLIKRRYVNMPSLRWHGMTQCGDNQLVVASSTV